MDNICIRQELGRSYIVSECEEKLENEYLVSMMTENSIRGLLSCKIVFENSRRMLFFDITNKISLDNEYQNKNIEIDDINIIFEKISMAYRESRKYLLDERYFVIKPEYIFVDPVSNDYSFLYLPGDEYKENSENPYDELADFLLQKVNQNNSLAVKITYLFYKMIKINTFSLESFMEIIEKEIIVSNDNKKELPERKEAEDVFELEPGFEEEEQNEGVKIIFLPMLITVLLVAAYFYMRNSIYEIYFLIGAVVVGLISVVLIIRSVVYLMNSKKDSELEYYMKNASEEDYWQDEQTQVFDDRTEVFDDTSQTYEKSYSLSWKEKGTQKNHKLTSFPVTIGKLSSEVDCCIAEQSISRIHAKIEKTNGKLYIRDMNSTNGTIINGQRLAAGENVQLDSETDIFLGNVRIRMREI